MTPAPWTARRSTPPQLARSAASVLLLCAATACAPAIKRTAAAPPTPAELDELWVQPDDIATRDLYNGPGGKDGAPVINGKLRIKSFDPSGNSVGYNVYDAENHEWKIKIGEEAQPEIVASRLLWAIGFHQPPLYLVHDVQLDGGRAQDSGHPARFRAEFGYKTEADWTWHQNPYVGTRQMNGLLVAQLIVNNWDIKGTQNRIYAMGNAAAPPKRRFVVQDLGAALGKTAWPVGTRGKIDDFESQRLIRRVVNGRIEFDYHARHKELFEHVTAADVVWVSKLFAQLTDQQWRDAFRAADYSDEITTRFVAKLKAKVAEGLALEQTAAATP
jgi:hypothetical protein